MTFSIKITQQAKAEYKGKVEIEVERDIYPAPAAPGAVLARGCETTPQGREMRRVSRVLAGAQTILLKTGG